MDEQRFRLAQLESQLKVVSEKFEREMLSRGFDPEQAENTALPASLAKLYLERQSLLDELDELQKGRES